MQAGELLHILHRQGQARLIAVDGLMLRAVVLEHPANILHAGNAPDIGKENPQAQETFHQVQEDRVLRHEVEQLRRPRGDGDKENRRQHQGKEDGACHLLI